MVDGIDRPVLSRVISIYSLKFGNENVNLEVIKISHSLTIWGFAQIIRPTQGKQVNAEQMTYHPPDKRTEYRLILFTKLYDYGISTDSEQFFLILG